MLQETLIGQAWAAVSSDDSGASPTPPARVDLTGEPGHLPSRFAVEEVAVATVSAALLAATAICELRGTPVSAVHVDRGHVADAVRSERHFSVNGQAAGAGFAPLSRFWRAKDGWVRTHANYPWHRRALVQALGTSEDADAVAAAFGNLSAQEIEDRVFAAGGVATAVRTLAAWHAHPQGQALATEPLVSHRVSGDGAPRPMTAADQPLADVRVLDLTRVIAGPVCTRLLGALGAQVMRLDPPGHADMAVGAVADTLLGKRSSFLDLETPEGLATLHDLLALADVVVCGYRPGSLDRFGLDEQSLTMRHAGIVAVFLDAWGHSGPWSGRRGFDSVVQAPTGIAMGESLTGDEPGALPCQVLDHGTGYLAAAAALDGLRRQRDGGGTHIRRLSLARTALWMASHGISREIQADGGSGGSATVPDSPPWLVELESPRGPVTAVAPPGVLGDRPLRWPTPVTGYGTDLATWSTP